MPLPWLVEKADWHEQDHPRDDHGRFVSDDEIDAARADPTKVAALRARVTDPEQRKKLDGHLRGQAENAGEFTAGGGGAKRPKAAGPKMSKVQAAKEIKKAEAQQRYYQPGSPNWQAQQDIIDRLTQFLAGPTKPNAGRTLGRDEIHKWEEDHFHDWAVSLDEDQRNAFRSYTSAGGYEAINGQLRGHGPMGHVAEQVAAMDAAIDKAVVPEAVTVFRGLRTAPPGLKKGAVFHNHGFVSTSLSEGTAEDFASAGEGHLMRITVPKGSKGASVSSLSDLGEAELLLPRSSRFKVTKVEKGRDFTVYHAELVHAS